jgi:2-hydroxychromene-2-carboxylate isomerase
VTVTPRPTIEFWYDFASTYSYLTALRIEDMAKAAGVDVVWQPFLLGPIFAAQGWTSSPFNLYPAKGANMIRDLERQAAERGVPFHKPDPFPQNSLLAARIATVGMTEGYVAAFTRMVFSAEFGDRQNISEPAVLIACLDRLGLDSARILKRAGDQDTKDRLRAATDAAIAAGIFGAPTLRTRDGEIFWGDDRLDPAIKWAAKL